MIVMTDEPRSISNICCKFESNCVSSTLSEECSARQQNNEGNVREVTNFDEAVSEWCQSGVRACRMCCVIEW